MATLRVASQVVTDWVLILGGTALSTISMESRAMLINPPYFSDPPGPRGFRASCVTPVQAPQSASYLVPPFVMPRSLAYSTSRAFHYNFWRDFGTHIVSADNHGHGGVVLPYSPEEDTAWCQLNQNFDSLDSAPSGSHLTNNGGIDSPYRCFAIMDRQPQPLFAILFPTLGDL
ncbi:uncharacterized protein BT62DRAFT_232438 [Guyanagaster necrorhizus]|uniref:Uncharacterized protein n=1 Tax=Guyanagaster necrorhizus TaxID=856835 RepID=A0A9P7VQQ5_9AGAR|nr:uncharacterized protein BT62DRAFT_232438 [Guyanagaster necrorhizus MCA 3950]KAG7444266.1 hypothetical protein BT62DRAFT_232438 [Guyanagaster necrorhizus MCA 3950]